MWGATDKKELWEIENKGCDWAVQSRVQLSGSRAMVNRWKVSVRIKFPRPGNAVEKAVWHNRLCWLIWFETKDRNSPLKLAVHLKTKTCDSFVFHWHSEENVQIAPNMFSFVSKILKETGKADSVVECAALVDYPVTGGVTGPLARSCSLYIDRENLLQPRVSVSRQNARFTFLLRSLLKSKKRLNLLIKLSENQISRRTVDCVLLHTHTHTHARARVCVSSLDVSVSVGESWLPKRACYWPKQIVVSRSLRVTADWPQSTELY